VQLVAQVGRDLGERMFAAVAWLFQKGPEPVLVLGTDAPTLPPRSIRIAALVLERGYEASRAGSSDDGYVMLGLREPNEALFRGVPWSTDAVCRETVDKAHTLALKVYEGELHDEVDTPEDLVHLKKELAANPEAALHTAEFLRSL
jgi:uncharacterized protein